MSSRDSYKKSVAVIGSGIAGCSAAFLLQKNNFDVTLMESQPTLGGHTLTTADPLPPVDLGFQVFNLTTYPNFTEMLEHLGVDSERSDMSFALSLDKGLLEWGSKRGLASLCAQRSNLCNPRFYGMVVEAIRFGYQATETLTNESLGKLTLGEYLKLRGYSDAFREWYVLPMCAAIWSSPNVEVLSFPIRPLVAFWKNHHLLDLFTPRPIWRVVKGRSKTYVDRIARELGENAVMKNMQAMAVRRGTNGQGVDVEVVDRSPKATQSTSTPMRVSTVMHFDAVVLACHADQALALLGESATPQERDVLAAIPYAPSDIYLHHDAKLMPRRHGAWASWNVIAEKKKDGDKRNVCVTYWAQSLQSFDKPTPDLFVTLNPFTPPDKDKTLLQLELRHPQLGGRAREAQAKLPSIQGNGSVYFTGAWANNGFHEDGLVASIEVAKRMCGDGDDNAAPAPCIPWSMDLHHRPLQGRNNPKPSCVEMACLTCFDRMASHALSGGAPMRIILPDGTERLYGDPNNRATNLIGADSEERYIPTLRAHSFELFKRIVYSHDIGLGEAYIRGEFDARRVGGSEGDGLSDVLAIMCRNLAQVENTRQSGGGAGVLSLLARAANSIGMAVYAAAHRARPNTREGSRKNIRAHYDLGNDLYKVFLDETMTYSSGVHRSTDDMAAPPAPAQHGSDASSDDDDRDSFDNADNAFRPDRLQTPPYQAMPLSPKMSLYDAQHNKFRLLLSRLTPAILADDPRCDDPSANHVTRSVLEIGCGWGALAMYGVTKFFANAITQGSKKPIHLRWIGITVSDEQLKEAQDRLAVSVAEGKLDEGVISYHICDYRDTKELFSLNRDGAFDGVVSVEMIEAVGHENLPEYFTSVSRALKPGRGVFSLQAISIPDKRYEAYRISSDFIREFIFPGGHLPCHDIMTQCAKAASLGSEPEFCLDIGPDYALTLRAWREAWEANKDVIVRKLGYSFALYRTYMFYFAYCEAAFQEKVLHDFVLSWTHTG
ncbi:cyclopropane fatty acid synthase [Pycnococcus provasolii]